MRKHWLRIGALLLAALLLLPTAGCSITEIVTSMEAVGDSTFMFCDSGSLYHWGDSTRFGGDGGDAFGYGRLFEYVPGVVSMAFGDGFGLWLTRDGVAVGGKSDHLPIGAGENLAPTLLCTLNSTGQESSFPDSYALVEIDLSDARQVAAADDFGLALLADGRLIRLDESGLREVTEVGTLTRVSAAPSGECAGVRQDGSAVLWGGSFGVPTEYTDASFTQAESAGTFVLALDEEGNAWVLDGQTARKQEGDFVSLAAGDGFAIGVSRSGDLYGWGVGNDGQLGSASRMDGEPLDVGLSGVIAVSCGRAHAVALRKDGTLWAWGAGEAGQLGTGTVSSEVALKLPEKTAKVDIR